MKKLGRWARPAFAFGCCLVILASAGSAGEIVERVVAVVGKEPILQSEAQAHLDLAIQSFSVDAGDTAGVSKLRGQVLEEMIEQEILYQEAQAGGISINDANVAAAVEEMLDRGRSQFRTEDAFQAQLRLEGLTLDDLRERYADQARREMAITQLIRQEIPEDQNITDEDVKKFFDDHREELPRRDPRIHLQHILVTARPDSTAHERARDLAQDVAARIRSGQIDFADAARRYSDDNNGRSGGDLGRVQRGDFRQRMGAAFEDSLFVSPVGRVAGPLQSPLGFHLLNVKEKDPAGQWVHAAHVLFAVPIVRADQVRAEERAREAYEALRAGTPFEEVARQYSDDASGVASGGDVGWIPLGAMEGELRIVKNVVDTLKIGETSSPLAGEGAVHIFRVMGREDERPYEFSEVAGELAQYVRAERQQARYREWVDELKKKYYIERRDWK